MLMQRLKALELSVAEGSWATASKLELLPLQTGLVSPAEHERALRHQLLLDRLDKARAKVGKQG